MIAVVAKLTVQDGKAEEFKSAAKEMVAAVKANEAGKALQYTLCQSPSNPNEFVFLERYVDDAALAEHGKSAHMAAFGGKIMGLLAGRPEISRLDVAASID